MVTLLYTEKYELYNATEYNVYLFSTQYPSTGPAMPMPTPGMTDVMVPQAMPAPPMPSVTGTP